jgi:hypothetical protein
MYPASSFTKSFDAFGVKILLLARDAPIAGIGRRFIGGYLHIYHGTNGSISWNFWDRGRK